MQESDFDNIANKLFLDRHAGFAWRHGEGIVRDVVLMLDTAMRDVSGRWALKRDFTIGMRRINIIMCSFNDIDDGTVRHYFGREGRYEGLADGEIRPFTNMLNAILERVVRMFNEQAKSRAAVEAAIAASGALKAPPAETDPMRHLEPIDVFKLSLPE